MQMLVENLRGTIVKIKQKFIFVEINTNGTDLLFFEKQKTLNHFHFYTYDHGKRIPGF